MKKRFQHRPSPAMVVAMVALFAAFAGPAVADQAVDFAKKKVINGKNIKNRSITGSKLKSNTLTGKQIRESKLGKVPSATKADTATAATNATNATNAVNAANATSLDGVTVKKISYDRAPVSPAETILDVAGLKLTANCAATADTNLIATTTKTDSSAYVAGIDGDDANDNVAGRDIDSDDLEDQAFDTGVTFDLDSQIGQGDANSNIGWFHYFAPDGSVVSVFLELDEFGTTKCLVKGFAIAG